MAWRARVAVGATCLVTAFLAAAAAAQASFSAHGSVEQVYVTHLAGGAQMSLLNPDGQTIRTKQADAEGGLLFRNVPPGTGYRVRLSATGEKSGPLTVLSTRPAPPSTAIYDQQIPSKGYGYLKTRDGIKLAIYVHPPEDVTKALPGFNPPPAPSGPTPTLIEYSGYAYDFFEPLQNLDGYDLIETIARQPWVLHHKVGMMGISYGGISQLFTAQTDPPSLAAISPLSVIDATQTTLYPGGILNTGFAVAWAKERIHDALPAGPDSGQRWAYDRIQQGDQTCKDNQALHGEAADLMAKIRANDHYVPKVADPLAPITFVNKINVPVFLACQFTDEQTGGHCADLAEHFTGTTRKWFTFTNGTHVDSLDPVTFNRWCDFLQLYVAQQAPAVNCAAIHAAAPLIYQEAMGISGVTIPPDPIQLQPTYQGALTAFQSLPSIRVLFDNGAGGSQPGDPQPAFEQSWPSFPIPGTSARYWYMGSD